MVLSLNSVRPSRRSVLAGLASLPLLPRGAGAVAAAPAVLSTSGLQFVTGYMVADAGSGATIEAWQEAQSRPPASMLKIATTLFSLDALGREYRFPTRVLATGPVEKGVVRGDLVLAGSGDPLLDTNALKALARELAKNGVSGVAGRFLLADGALPCLDLVDPGQPRHVGYNPAISGLNLNFNRVRLDWTPAKEGTRLSFVAPGVDFEVPVTMVRGETGGTAPPRHRIEGESEVWQLADASLRRPGRVWLPVRRPSLYAGEVFRTLAAGEGVVLPEGERIAAAPEGEVLASHRSVTLAVMLRGMLRYSTNLTAEVVGLRAAQALDAEPQDITGSAARMTEWAHDRYGLRRADFADHSGLSDTSAWSPEEIVKVLLADSSRLRGLLKERTVTDENREALRVDGLRVEAKSGTLYFASGLAGYVETRGQVMAFAVSSADMDRRSGIDPMAASRPAGSRVWSRRARGVQNDLLRRWIRAKHPRAPLRPRPRPA